MLPNILDQCYMRRKHSVTVSIWFFSSWDVFESSTNHVQCVRLHKSFCIQTYPMMGVRIWVRSGPTTVTWCLTWCWCNLSAFVSGDGPHWSRCCREPLDKMLLSEDEWGEIAEHNSGFRPYMDTILQNDPNKYNKFIKDLYDKNMVDITFSPKDLIAPFFVKKKNGKLRLVLDCRGVNRRFHPPPPMALSAGSTWSQVSLPDGQQLSIAQVLTSVMARWSWFHMLTIWMWRERALIEFKK